MGDLMQFALVTFTSVLFIVDPIAVVPTYLVITQGETSAQRANTARRACVAAGIILVAFGLAGAQIFKLFGITIEAFRIAGGLILETYRSSVALAAAAASALLAALVARLALKNR